MILDKIIETKKVELEQLTTEVPLARVREAASAMMSTRDFKAALSSRQCAIIAEIKRRSPSKGLLRGDLNAVTMAELYERNGAAAVSVLTDKTFFGGDIQDLTDVRKKIAIPILRKDFVIDAYQIYEARAAGADAVLLIAAVLKDGRLAEFIELAESLRIAALVEIHSREELDRALSARAEIIGINNRDLKTFKTDLKVSLDMAPLIPEKCLAVSESGISGRKDIQELMNAGIHAFLVGELLMTAPDAGMRLKELMGL
jgi:indole-3-glycerol phosphate synthase